MKKGIKIFAVMVALIALLGACKVVDPCPAYDTIDIELQDIF